MCELIVILVAVDPEADRLWGEVEASRENCLRDDLGYRSRYYAETRLVNAWNAYATHVGLPQAK